MSVKNIMVSFIFSVLLTACTQGASNNAATSASHAGASAQHAAGSAAHGSAAAVQTGSAASAVPLKASGAVGKVADQAGDALLNVSGKPLPIADDEVKAGGPPKTE